MTTATQEVGTTPIKGTLQTSKPELTQQFEILVSITSFLLIFGVHLDGWAHNNLPSSLETFFTPWHAVLYGGFATLAAVLVFYFIRNLAAGYPLSKAMPDGFLLSILGVLVFLTGGVGDGIWHTLLGIEDTVDALYSPTHLLLAIGGALMFTGSLRYAWRNTETWQQRDFIGKLPAMLSLGYFTSLIFFFHQYAVPTHSIFASDSFGDLSNPSIAFYNEGLGVLGIIVFSFILALILLKSYRKLQLPKGSYTILIGMIVFFGSIMRFPIGDQAEFMNQLARVLFVVMALGIGYFSDHITNSSLIEQHKELGLSIAVPVIFFTGYMIIVLVTLGTVYSLHLVFGIPVLAGLVGYLAKLTQE